MANKRSRLNIFCLLVLLLCQGAELSRAIRINDVPGSNGNAVQVSSTISTATAPPLRPNIYRVSKPAPKEPTKRVPPHLQDVRQGYVDDDAGDVIRIIEPPQHFQQLKRLRQQQLVHKPQSTAVIWEQPRKVSSNRKPVPVRPSHLPKNSAAVDLLTQETRLNSGALPQLNNLQLPMEILASVRKTERLLQRNRSKLPLVRQRHIVRQSHTLIAQKAQGQQQYHREQQHRLRAALTKEHKRSKRVKRHLQQISKKRVERSSYEVEQGLKLVAHISELLQNATQFLPDEDESKTNVAEVVKVSEVHISTTATTTAPLKKTTAKPFEHKPCQNAAKCDTKAQRLQQQALRRRQQLFKQAHGTRTATPTATPASKPTTTSRSFRLPEATTTTTSTTSATTRRWSPKQLSSRLANASKSLNRSSVNQLPQRRSDKRAGASRSFQLHTEKSGALTRASAELLYDDVMTNIRNLWQEHDEVAPPEFVAPANVANNSDYRALDVYLKELNDISRRLPTVAPITTFNSNDTSLEQSTLKFKLNTEEFERITPTPSWYLINRDGKIYETRLDSETKPEAELFHRFPDMPKNEDSSEQETLLVLE